MNSVEYGNALMRIFQLAEADPAPGTADAAELTALVSEVVVYEAANFRFSPPSEREGNKQ